MPMTTPARDRFGNPIDPGVGYARGRLLASSTDEIGRLRRAQAITAEIVAERGLDAIAIFTGNPRYFPLKPEDLADLCEEWIGPGLFGEALRQAAIEHLGGRAGDAAAIFNRTSAGIIAAILALSDGRPLVSIVPRDGRSHASVLRGARLAGVRLVEVPGEGDVAAALAEHRPALVVVTTVTSGLERLPDQVTLAAVRQAKQQDAIVLLDEAYGARLRPVLHDGLPSLQLEADASITNSDKAGLTGPRAGIMAGRPEVVLAVLAKASEHGMEARAPIAAGALRALQGFTPDLLRQEAAEGQRIAEILSAKYGPDIVVRSDLGPIIHEEDVFEIVNRRAAGSGRPEAAGLVPCEITAALAMILLKTEGIVLVNTHGAPGGRVSLRLKPTAGALKKVGGAEALVKKIDQAIDELAGHLEDTAYFARLLFGEG
jgi:L-seryl-tRNA(Ser) seleniumtransferase